MSPRPNGFVLIAVLWALAAAALMAAHIDAVTTSQVENARLAKQSFERTLDRRSTQATVTYLFTTGRMNHRGLILETPQRFSDRLSEIGTLSDRGEGELHVTDQVYRGLGTTRFAVQDEGGLASVNSPMVPLFGALLRWVGIAQEDVAHIIARAEDYIDMDRTLRLYGAEAGHYRDRGKPPPPNWIMASPLELQRVLGLTEIVTPAQWRRLVPLLSMRPSVGYNFNTMPPEVLAALLDLDLRSVQPLLDDRAAQPISRLSFLAMRTGKHLDIDPSDLRLIPSRFLRMTLWHEDDGVRMLVGIELTPFSDVAPWRIDYRYEEPVTARAARPPRTVATPLLQ